MSLSRTTRTLGAALMLVGTGCTSTTLRFRDAVGPSPQLPPVEGQVDGQLIVYTEIFYRGGPDLAPDSREGYDLFDRSGAHLEHVWTPDTKPAVVTLRAGDYLVRGRGLGEAHVEVPVRVVAGRITEVYLDKEAPAATGAPSRTAVYGPNHAFVGWRAVPFQQVCPTLRLRPGTARLIAVTEVCLESTSPLTGRTRWKTLRATPRHAEPPVVAAHTRVLSARNSTRNVLETDAAFQGPDHIGRRRRGGNVRLQESGQTRFRDGPASLERASHRQFA